MKTLFLLFINVKQWLVVLLANNIIHTRLKLNIINIHLRLFKCFHYLLIIKYLKR